LTFLAVARPQATNFEKIVMLENSHNVYQNALFSMQVAISKDNPVEQKSLLSESFEYIRKAVEDEEKLKRIIIDNSASVKIAEHIMNYEERGAKLYDKPPLNLMDKPRYIKKTNVPPKPIFLGRTTTTITMKLPYFRPITDHKEWRNVSKMSLFGKESGSGVAVSLNNTEFPGTGDRVDPGTTITISGLTPNRKYVFACGGYTNENICVNGIGETSEEILTCLPLNFNILYGYLSQIAFKLRQFAISKKAAESLLMQFIEKNETRYRLLNGEKNPALLYKLKYSDINLISVTTIRQIVEAFLMLANISKIHKPKFDKSPSSIDSVEVKRTKLQLRICNFLLLSLELSILLKNPILIKRTIGELFSHTLPFLSFDPRPEFMRGYLLYFHQAVLTIPADQMDSSMRRIGSCLSYEVSKDFIFHLQGEEHELYHTVLKTELTLELRKWQTYSQIVTKIDQLTEEDLEKQKKQQEAIQNGEEVPPEDLVKDPEPYDVTETYCTELEKEGDAYEQFLAMFKDQYTEERADKWKAKLHKLAPKLTNGDEVIESLISDIQTNVNFWKGVKEDPESQIKNEALKEHPKFLEFVYKAFQRIIELGQKSNEEIKELVDNVDIGEEEIQTVEENINKTREDLSHDIVQRRQNRYNLIEEKVRIIIDRADEVHISMVDLDKLFNDIRRELASSEQFEKTEFNVAKTRYLLQVSQFLFLKAMVTTLVHRKDFDYKKDTGLPSYQDIQLLDFSDFISQVNDFRETIVSERGRIRSEIIEKAEKENQENPPADGEEETKIPEEDEIEVPVDVRVKAISECINLLSRSCQYSRVSKSWVLLENIVKYTWNLITYELVSPLEMSQTGAYKDVFLMTECVLNLLSLTKMVNKIDDNQSATSESSRGGRTVKFADETKIGGFGKKVTASYSDIKFYLDFISFTIQCLFVAEKWESMVDLADTASKQIWVLFPDPENEMLFLLGYLLQYTIYGENKLFTEASQKTTKVKNTLDNRIKQFTHWKATSKKSKSRRALLTGEVPKEELDFRKEKAELERETFRLEVHETILKSDKSESEVALDRINKSFSMAKEKLRQSRKLYKKFGLETADLDKQIETHGYSNMIAIRKKSHAVMTNMVISSYNKAIELIRKRQEKFLLLQSLHEIGNLYYSDNQLKQAETQWNDCVDTIFQKDVGILRVFRNVFKENPNLAAVFGPMQCLIGGIVLAKLAKLCYNTNAHLQRESIIMGSELFAAPFKLSMFHPHEKHDFVNYRMKEFLPDITLLTEKQMIKPVDLLSGLDIMSEMLIDYQLYSRVLPLATLMNYVATDLVKTISFSIKARVLKGIALCHLGYISESVNLFYQIVENKDKIINVINESEYLKQKEGNSFKFKDAKYSYRNDLPPESEENVNTINNLLMVTFNLCETSKVSPLLNSQVHYLKHLILLTVCKDPFDISATEDLRSKYFSQAEEGFNQVIKMIKEEEEVILLKYKIKSVIHNPHQDARTGKYVEFLRRKLKKALQFEVAEEDNPEFVPKTKFDNTDEEQPHSIRRSCRLSWIIRCKLRLAELFRKRGSLLDAFYITRDNLLEIAKMNMPIGITNDVEKQYSDSKFKIPEDISGGAPAGKKAAPGKEDKKADTKKDKGKGKVEEPDQNEEEDRQYEMEDRRIWTEMNLENGEKSELPCAYMWAMAKYEFIDVLFTQGRYDETIAQIEVAKVELEAINDTYYMRLYYELLTMIKVHQGDLSGSMDMFHGLKAYAKRLSHDDIKLAQFYSNIGEFMYTSFPEFAVDIFKESRDLFWINMKSRGLKIIDVHEHIDAENGSIKQEKIPDSKDKKEENKAPVEEKKDPKQKGKVDPKAEASVEKDYSQIPRVIKYEKDLHHELFIIDDQEASKKNMNSNIYLFQLDNLIKANIRYAQALCTLDTKYDLSIMIIKESLKIISR